MSTVKGLKFPAGLNIEIRPSKRQAELWNLLQPNQCPHCGGTIKQTVVGVNANGRNSYKPQCTKCGTFHLPQLILGGGAAGGGKALKLNGLVCTPFGFREVGVLKKGDIITNPMTGKMQKIIHVHPIETHDYYRVKFIDGTFIDCSAGHLWNCHVSSNKTKRAKYNEGLSIDRVWETCDMYEWYQRKAQGMYKGVHLIIPLTEPVQFTPGSHKPTIAPYVLGALVGDGYLQSASGKSNIVSFTSMDDEIRDRFVEYGYDMSDFVLDGSHGRARAFRIHSPELAEELRKLGLAECTSKTAFIPKYYKIATIEDRIALMQGLIDTDGYVDDRGHISYTSISKQLAEDVAFIVRSLGGVATITKNKAGYKKNGEFVQCNDAYDVQIRTKMNPDLCGLARKKERATYDFNGGASELGKRIVDIEYIGQQEGRCITVDDPSGLFVTNDFTVTHNSWLGSNWICSLCIRFPDIRCVIARKTIKSLKESTFNTVKSVLMNWGLKEGEHYKINNLENWLLFWNGSIIYLKELEEKPSDLSYERLGSTEITAAFVDEVSEISERAIEVLMSRCRWKVADYMGYPRVLMTTNPCATWVRSRFVQDDDGNEIVPADTDAYVKFTVYDNPNEEFVQVYENNLKNIKDPATRARLLEGNWDFVDANDAAAYWKFDGEKHLVANLKEKVYDPLKPLILSFDFNVIPYMSCLAFQLDYEKKKIYVLEEILGKPEDKENNTPKLAQKLKRKLLTTGHSGGLFITGDPAGLARSTQTEEGVNNFTILVDNLDDPVLRPRRKLLKKQPSQMARLEFINALFEGYDGWSIEIDLRCRRFTEDLIYQKKNSDGTKSKAKVTDPKLGVKYEKYGHLSDCFDYFCCLFVDKAWGKFQSKSGPGIATVNNIPVYGTFEY